MGIWSQQRTRLRLLRQNLFSSHYFQELNLPVIIGFVVLLLIKQEGLLEYVTNDLEPVDGVLPQCLILLLLVLLSPLYLGSLLLEVMKLALKLLPVFLVLFQFIVPYGSFDGHDPLLLPVFEYCLDVLHNIVLLGLAPVDLLSGSLRSHGHVRGVL